MYIYRMRNIRSQRWKKDPKGMSSLSEGPNKAFKEKCSICEVSKYKTAQYMLVEMTMSALSRAAQKSEPIEQ